MWGIGRELEVRALPANQIVVELGADEHGDPVVSADRTEGWLEEDGHFASSYRCSWGSR
jgi:hypothetical protein